MTATGVAARALAEHDGLDWGDLDDTARTAYRQQARAVLRALRAWSLLCLVCGDPHPYRRDALGRPVRATDHPFQPGPRIPDPDRDAED